MENSNVVCYDDLIELHHQALLGGIEYDDLDIFEEDVDYTVLSEDCTYDCNW